jgi:PAS domain S-box-containing protein
MNRLSLIRAFAVALTNLEDKDRLAWFAAREIVGPMGFADCVIYYLDEQRTALIQQAAIGDSKNPSGTEIANRLQIQIGDGITGHVAKTKAPLVIADVRDDPRYIEDVESCRSEICVPILAGETLLGVIDCEDPAIDRFNDADVEILLTVAALVGARLMQYRRQAETLKNPRLEQNLRLAEERGVAIARLAHVGHFVWDTRARRTVSCSEEMGRIHGTTAATYIEQTNSLEKLMEWIHPDDHTLYNTAITKACGTKSGYDVQIRILARDGVTRHVREVGDPTFDKDGEPIVTNGIMQDVTDLAQTTHELSETDQRLRQLLDRTREGYWYIDTEGFTIDANPAMCALLQRPLETIIGRHVFDFLDETNENIFKEQIAKRRSGQNDAYEIELTREDGTLVPCINTATSLFDRHGNRTGSVGLWTDITEQRRSRVMLEKARDEAENANRAKSEFLSSMSHELRTPLNAILGFGQLLQSDPQFSAIESSRIATDQIVSGGHHLLELIDDILNLAQIETGNVPLNIERVDAVEVTRSAIRLLQRSAADRGIIINTENFEMPAPDIEVDANKFEQVLLNILSNAIKYNIENGTITVAFSTMEPDRMRCTISDTGTGIEESKRSQIFEPFNRLGAERGPIQGTGIGLAITRELTLKMGGRIGYAPGLDHGSSFWVEYPIARAVLEAEPVATAAAESAVPTTVTTDGFPPTHKVLYIEDNPANQLLMEKIFDRFPHLTFFSARSAETGLRLALEINPDVILMDVNLPGMSGIEAMGEMRRHSSLNTIPVIAISADAMPHDVQRGFAAGFREYVKKPFMIPEILSSINSCLDNRG